MITKMKAFPIYPTMEPANYGVFDIVEFGQQVRSIDGYRYVAPYVDHCTNKLMVYGMKSNDELLSTLKLIIHQYGLTHNKNSFPGSQDPSRPFSAREAPSTPLFSTIPLNALR